MCTVAMLSNPLASVTVALEFDDDGAMFSCWCAERGHVSTSLVENAVDAIEVARVPARLRAAGWD